MGPVSKSKRALSLVLIIAATWIVFDAALYCFDKSRFFSPNYRKETFVDANNKRTLVCYPSNPHGYFDIDLRDAATRARFGITVAMGLYTPFCVEEKYNAFGYRDTDKDFTGKKARVAFLGDSFVKGEGVKASDRFTDILAKDYWGSRVDVYNFGTSGAGIQDIYSKDFKGAIHISADMIVYAYNLNDAVMSDEMARKQKYINDLMNVRYYNSRVFKYFDERIKRYEKNPFKRAIFRTGKGMISRSRLLFVLRKLFIDRLVTGQTIAWYKDIYSGSNPGWEATQSILLMMKSESAKSGTPFCLVILPIFYDFNNYPFDGIHNMIVEFCRKNDIEVIDVLPRFKGLNYRDYIVHPLDYHPNREAHKLIAREINRLLKNKITMVIEKKEREALP